MSQLFQLSPYLTVINNSQGNFLEKTIINWKTNSLMKEQ